MNPEDCITDAELVALAKELQRKLALCREAMHSAIQCVEEASTYEERTLLVEHLSETLNATKP